MQRPDFLFNGAYVFYFLSSLPLPLSRSHHGSVWVLPVISLLLTSTVSPRFRMIQKEDDCRPLSVQSYQFLLFSTLRSAQLFWEPGGNPGTRTSSCSRRYGHLRLVLSHSHTSKEMYQKYEIDHKGGYRLSEVLKSHNQSYVLEIMSEFLCKRDIFFQSLSNYTNFMLCFVIWCTIRYPCVLKELHIGYYKLEDRGV